MEALYKKLYDKYTKLKTKKMSDIDQLNKDQEVKFLNYVSAAEELIQHLKSENDRLRLQVNELRDEVVSTRSSMDAKCADYQKLLMEENQRNSTLSEEIDKLRKLQQEGNFGSFNNGITKELHTPSGSRSVYGEVSKGPSGGTTRRKRSRDATQVTDELRVVDASAQADPTQRQSTSELPEKAASSEFANMQLGCCGSKDGSLNDCISTNCPYQCLVEHMMGVEVSTTDRNEGICISAFHKSSGYSFSLTWINKLAGEAEILYRVLSLGTFERVAPEWMKEAIIFSTSMCPTFLEKVTRVIKLHC